jgi:hypothetical protein
MPIACPRCGAFVAKDAPSCGHCGYQLAPATTFLNLNFPPEHPQYDFGQPNDQWPAPAPTLMPGVQPFPVPPPTPPRKTLAVVVGAIAFVVVAGVVAAVVLLGGGTNGDPSAASTGGDSSTPSQPPASIVDEPEPAEPTTTTLPPDQAPTDEASAHQMLDDEVANDHDAVESITEEWVPQLSSKRLGLKANGTVYDYQTIWADFTSLSTEYPGAMMLWSGDYQSFKLQDFYVTIAPASFATGAEANQWCDAAGIDADNCFAKRITHTGSYADSTLSRK